MKQKMICSSCGTVLAEVNFLGDQPLCDSCYQEQSLFCVCCGERIHPDQNAGDDDTPLCRECREQYYVVCENCGRLIEESHVYYHESDEALCSDCYQKKQEQSIIHDYYYKPEPIFYGEDSRYFGVELEIDEGGESSANAGKIVEIANGTDERVYCKHDGSLNDGFEIVTHPMTLSYHMEVMPWKGMLSKAVQMDYLSHQSGTCGLHIHVNRTALGNSESTQEEVIARLLYFFEKNWEELLKFSRRTQAQLASWAARYGYREKPKEILDNVKQGYGNGRYSCINLQNRNTVEFRIFRGTLKYSTLIATLQLVWHLCDVAISFSDEELAELSWTSFVAGIPQKQYPELIQYLKERRLYLNEPVSGEEEV